MMEFSASEASEYDSGGETDCSESESEGEGEQAPQLSCSGTRKFTWARAETFDRALSKRVPSRKRSRATARQAVDSDESDTFDAAEGFCLALSEPAQQMVDALGGVEFSLISNRTRRQGGAPSPFRISRDAAASPRGQIVGLRRSVARSSLPWR